MIAIAILSIGAVGLLAALGFGLFSSEYGARVSFASAYNRKVIELLQAKAVSDTGLTAVTVPGNVTDAGDDPDWRALDSGLLANTGGAIPNLWGATPEDRERFARQAAEFQTNIALAREIPSWFSETDINRKFRNQLARVTVTTRWRTRGTWRSVRTVGYHMMAPAP